MIVVIGVVLVIVVMWIIICEIDVPYYVEWKVLLIMSAVIAIPLAIVLALMFFNENMCDKFETVERINIYAGYNDSEINGHFFLASGRIDEADVVYYWINNSGVKSKHSQPMDRSVFIEDGGEYLLIKRNACHEGWRWFFVCTDVIAEFHVPENSIRKMYQYQ
jgi:hypothetical protein